MVKIKIQIAPNGPVIVEGCDKLLGTDGKNFDCSKKMTLCRCGDSAKKPFCDGAHVKKGFSGAKEEDRARDKRKEYTGDAITINYNYGVCSHASVCVKRLPTVFDPSKRPWINPNEATVDQLIDTVKKCPSGALSYTLNGQEYIDQDRPQALTIEPNGPLNIEGGAKLEGIDWGQGASKEHFQLCRCGKSKNKPFCDGAHYKHKFE